MSESTKTEEAMKATLELKPGDRVRSFDFEGKDTEGSRACYMDGRLDGILKAGETDSETGFQAHGCEW